MNLAARCSNRCSLRGGEREREREGERERERERERENHHVHSTVCVNVDAEAMHALNLSIQAVQMSCANEACPGGLTSHKE